MIIGNLGKDPELRPTGSGVSVCSFSVATADRRKDQAGNWAEHTEWHSIVTFGKTAENCSKFLKKGRQVFIEGRLQTRKWQDKEGKDRYTTEIIADTVQFLGARQEGAGPQSFAGPGFEEQAMQQVGNSSAIFSSLKSADSISQRPAPASSPSFDDDDIPF